MNIVKAELNRKFFTQIEFESLQFKFSGFETLFQHKGQELIIKIECELSLEEIHNFLFKLFDMIFLFIGSYPQIVKVEDNNSQLDTKQFVSKYSSWNFFIRRGAAICNINSNTINEQTILQYSKIPQLPLFSLQYLLSENYQYQLIPHKITLLLHIVDGIVPNEIVKKMKKEIISKYQPCKEDGQLQAASEIGNYMAKVYYLFNTHFFVHDDKHNYEILSLLQKNQFSFLQVICDTRNWYSHFSEKEMPHRLKQGNDMAVYFEIIVYVIRLYLINELKIPINKNWVDEFFYSIHDWISDVYKLNRPLKSNAYQLYMFLMFLSEYCEFKK